MPVTARARLRQLATQVGGTADDTVRHSATLWLAEWDQLEPVWRQAITDIVSRYQATGVWPPPWEIARIPTVASAQARSGQVATLLAAQASVTAASAAAVVTAVTLAAQPALIAAAVGEIASGAAAHQAAAALTARQQRIADLHRPIAGAMTDQGRRIVAHPGALPVGPVEAVDTVLGRVRAGFDAGLSRAVTIARTELVDTYRTAAHLVDTANRHLFGEWEWRSQLDSRTCFPAGTLIQTGCGPVAIEAVHVGDLVLTHTGSWQYVYETMSRSYTGQMVTVEAEGLNVTSTGDHPFLIERQGQLQWVEAGRLRVGDAVLSPLKRFSHEVDHRVVKRSVERRSNKPNHAESEPAEVLVLPRIPGRHPVMPVRLVDLQRDGAIHDEVDRALPSRHGDLLLECDAESFKAAPHVRFGDGFPRMSPIAPDRAEPIPVQFGRENPERVTAGEAFHEMNRSPAFLGAVPTAYPPRGCDAEGFAAPFTRGVLGVSGLASHGARRVAVGIAPGDGEAPAATGAGLRYLAHGGGALAGAAGRGPGGTRLEFPTATAASPCDPGQRGGGTFAAVGIDSLVGAVALPAAEFPGPSADPRRWDLEDGSADLATPFHRRIVSRLTTQHQAVRVFNLEVEANHSYVANGFAVHNCPSCWAMHGTRWPITTPGPSGHPNCRCMRLPVPRSGGPTDDAAARFARLPRARQLAVMGPARLALLRSGRIRWADLAIRRTTNGWRPSYQTRTVRDLQNLADRRAA